MSELEKDQKIAEVGDVGLPEDLARADLYGLIARFFLLPPDQELLDQIAASIPEGQGSADEAPLARLWDNLVELAKNNPAQAWRDEFDANFISVGKPNVVLNASFYLAGHLNEKPLVEIRRSLDTFGLEAAENITETEDHIAALCEVMRYLIAGDDVVISNLTNQRIFFNAHIRPWYDELCDAIEIIPDMHLYHSVAALTREFMAIEAQGFDMI
ncbi:MAG: cytoplasmic chaperone TorD family protein [Polynucleobacter sp. 24-46-87]|uniref:TorD/DmsD family molecular chaperone n=1 Tax=unclassified Polynucleobacter TaxID=2640945 RepID=UPI000BC4DD87|nr:MULTISPECIES: molecular chaperone TorD family protein [unclassified Polynucleobacter]OYY14075.1 MAG: cytoplasmic chaperone TorD family protein [Polynucleobacter sp. 35-46-11]OZA12840.1 MAG: cytoplasmic chaperone TorD family protein [Polynucleobacter sp. 24-46-87]OZA72919.1 MAG: cytoplasmic chaperone TorD family protein [Polynucleobacter sp. 39-46-10]